MDYSLLQYQHYSHNEKVQLFDNIKYSLSQLNLKENKTVVKIKRCLSDIFYDSNENTYLRKKSLETICHLTVAGHFRKNYTHDLLLDVEQEDDIFIICKAIEYLFYFKDVNEEETVSRLNLLATHNSSEVISEVYFRLGQIHFFNGGQEHKDNFNLSRNYFEKSYYEDSNRVDAQFYLSAIGLIYNIDVGNHNILSNLWNLEVFSDIDTLSPLYNGIYAVLSHYIEIKKKKFSKFIDSSEYKELCHLFYLLINVQLKSELDKFYLDELKNNLKTDYLEPFFYHSAKAEKVRIERLVDESQTKDEQVFWEYILDLINKDFNKKKDNSYLLDLPNFTIQNTPYSIIIEQITSGIEDGKPVKDIIAQYVYPLIKESNTIYTGSNIGDDIFKSIVEELQNKLDDYKKERFLEFQLVLEDVVRYIVRASEGERNNTNWSFLFDPDAKEDDLQNSMLDLFKFSSFKASCYSKEAKEFTDGGRVDIKYQSDILTIPIELKRTFEIVTEEKIKADYLAQAQTYTYNKDRLGIFVLLDLTKKIPSKPMKNLRDLNGIIHLETHHKVNEKHPDYIVWFVIPGNKILPSKRSKYSSKK